MHYVSLQNLIEIYAQQFDSEKEAIRKIKSNFASFFVSQNNDVERYLKKTCFEHQKRSLSRTYLFIKPKKNMNFDVIGYFSIALKALSLNEDHGLSRGMLKRFCSRGKEETTVCFLIGQIGKNDSFKKEINLKKILNSINIEFNAVKKIIGGSTILLECQKANGKLRKLYEEHGFIFVQDTDKLTQLLKFDIK